MIDKEPDIRVGILLPDDLIKTVEIRCPTKPAYDLLDDTGKSYGPREGTELIFSAEGGSVQADAAGIPRTSRRWWILKPSRSEGKLHKEDGLRIAGVPAGRGFHWQKRIVNVLPGILEIRSLEDSLVLVNQLGLEDYVKCVVVSEMGPDCPENFISSQTIVARSWLLAGTEKKHAHQGFDVCNDDCCQRYQGTNHLTEQSIRGGDRTRGQVLMVDQSICDARYSKCCGGMMETFENVWPGKPLSYSRSLPDAAEPYSVHRNPLCEEREFREWVEDFPKAFCSPHTVPEKRVPRYLGDVDEQGSYFRWKLRYTQKELTDLLNEKLRLRAVSIHHIEPKRRGGSGRLIELVIHYHDGESSGNMACTVKDQYRIRQVFHPKFLYSSAFIVDETGGEKGVPEMFSLRGAGWGHGVGMCQIGAVGMALEGYSTAEILTQYYPGTELKTIY